MTNEATDGETVTALTSGGPPVTWETLGKMWQDQVLIDQAYNNLLKAIFDPEPEVEKDMAFTKSPVKHGLTCAGVDFVLGDNLECCNVCVMNHNFLKKGGGHRMRWSGILTPTLPNGEAIDEKAAWVCCKHHARIERITMVGGWDQFRKLIHNEAKGLDLSGKLMTITPGEAVDWLVQHPHLPTSWMGSALTIETHWDGGGPTFLTKKWEMGKIAKGDYPLESPYGSAWPAGHDEKATSLMICEDPKCQGCQSFGSHYWSAKLNGWMDRHIYGWFDHLYGLSHQFKVSDCYGGGPVIPGQMANTVQRTLDGVEYLFVPEYDLWTWKTGISESSIHLHFADPHAIAIVTLGSGNPEGLSWCLVSHVPEQNIKEYLTKPTSLSTIKKWIVYV